MAKVQRVTLRRPIILSGGQTGVDRAALDWAMTRALRVEGWCPRGRRAEDGVIPARYPLRETAESSYSARTRRNVETADATLILTRGKPKGGTALTARAALEADRPFFVATLGETPAEVVLLWLIKNLPERLNVAGPRESQAPGIGRETKRYLSRIFRGVTLVCDLHRVPRPGRSGRPRLVGPKGVSRA